MSKPKINWNEFSSVLGGKGFSQNDKSVLYNIYKEGGLSKKDLKNTEFLREKLSENIESDKLKSYGNLSNVSPDVLKTIASNLSSKEIINLCQTNQYFNKVLCMSPNDLFWKKVYRSEFGIPYEECISPFNLIKNDYILSKKNPKLLKFIKEYTNYNDYRIHKQKKIYNTTKKLIETITRKFFGGIPPTRENLILTEEDYYEVITGDPQETLGDYIVGLLGLLSYEYGGNSVVSMQVQYDENVIERVSEEDPVDYIWSEFPEPLYDVTDVINDMYGTKYKWEE